MSNLTPIVDATEGFFKGVVKPILDKFVPDAQQRVEAEQFAQAQIDKLNLAQIDLNKTEAASTNWFIAGWRPYIGWGCGTAFLYSALFEPLLRFIATVFFGYTGLYPVLDTSITMQVLVALLGMASLRTYDKIQAAK